jgi:hypothetical protein
MESRMSIDMFGDIHWELPNGVHHREDGPAIEDTQGYKAWYLNGIEYTEKQHKYEMRSIKLKQLL